MIAQWPFELRNDKNYIFFVSQSNDHCHDMVQGVHGSYTQYHQLYDHNLEILMNLVYNYKLQITEIPFDRVLIQHFQQNNVYSGTGDHK